MIDSRQIIALALVIVGCGCSPAGVESAPATEGPTMTATAEPTPSATAGPPRLDEGPIEPGVYYVPRGAWSDVPFTITVPDGWVGHNGGRTLSKHVDDPENEVSIGPFALTHIFTDACSPEAGEGDRQELGPSADDLVRALMEQRNGAVISEPVDVTIDGRAVAQYELTVPPELDLTTCRPPAPVGIQLWQDVGTKYFVLLADGAAALYVADISGERFVVTAQHWNSSLPADIAEMEEMVASIQFED
jgi:hypothetical protein